MIRRRAFAKVLRIHSNQAEEINWNPKRYPSSNWEGGPLDLAQKKWWNLTRDTILERLISSRQTVNYVAGPHIKEMVAGAQAMKLSEFSPDVPENFLISGKRITRLTELAVASCSQISRSVFWPCIRLWEWHYFSGLIGIDLFICDRVG